MIEWKKFKIRDVFEVRKGKRLPERVLFDTNGDIALINQSSQNNMVSRYSGLQGNNEIYPPNSITFGVNTKSFGYQKSEFYTIADVLFLRNIHLNERVALYMITVIRKCIPLYGWDKIFGLNQMKDTEIRLPVDKNGEIDYNYMDSRVRELEQNRIIELKQDCAIELNTYLTVCGFNNCKLSNNEKQVVKRYSNGEVEYKEYKIGNLFDIHPTKSYGYTNRKLFKVKGKTPVVVNSSVNNGIGGYVNLAPTEKGNIITYSDTTTADGIFYQPNDFIGYSHVQGFYPLNDIKWSEKALLYILTLFKQQAKGRFDYANKFNRKIAKEIAIKLPVTSSGDIDFIFMENFITAQYKIAVKDVCDLKYKYIKITKELILKSG